LHANVPRDRMVFGFGGAFRFILIVRAMWHA
jgi:hypothetical protein